MTLLDLGVPAVPGAAGTPDPAGLAGRGPDTRLVDSWGRVATDLRVSLTDRCNLRCTYCMPAEGLEWMPSEQALTDDEVVRLVRVAVEQLGVSEIRFTGGEPLLPPGLAHIVAVAGFHQHRPPHSSPGRPFQHHEPGHSVRALTHAYHHGPHAVQLRRQPAMRFDDVPKPALHLRFLLPRRAAPRVTALDRRGYGLRH